LVAVEQFTNRAFVLPTKGKDTRQWLDSIAKFVELTRQVCILYSDRDSVATSPSFRNQIQEKYGIVWRFLKKGHKAFTAERMIGIVKTALSKALEFRQMQQQEEGSESLAKFRRWEDLVQPFVTNYNKQLVPGTAYKRQAVSRENFNDFFAQLTGKPDFYSDFNSYTAGPFENKAWNKKFFKFRIGDKVRVLKSANWKEKKPALKRNPWTARSEEIFTPYLLGSSGPPLTFEKETDGSCPSIDWKRWDLTDASFTRKSCS